MSDMVVDIMTKEELPWEMEVRQELKREQLKRKKEKEASEHIVKDKFKLFTPGIVDLTYTKDELGKSNNDYLSISTTNQVLYGNLVQSTSVTTKGIKVNNVVWSRDILDNRKLLLGDSYMSYPFSFKGGNSYRGMKISKKNSWDSGMSVTRNNIKGKASDGLMVELYENNILKSYQIVKNSEYNFNENTVDGINKYEIRIYNSDGTITKKKITAYENHMYLERNNFDYEIEVGQHIIYSNETIHNLRLLYGLTKDTTISISNYNVLKEKEDQKTGKQTINKIVFNNYSVLQRFSLLDIIPNNIEGNYSENIKNRNQNMFRLNLESDLHIFTNSIGIEKYNNFKDDEIGLDYDEKKYETISLNVFGINTRLGYENYSQSDEDKYVNSYNLGLGRKVFSNFLYADLSLYKKVYNTQENEQGIGIRLSHHVDGKMKKYFDTVVVGWEKSGKNSNYQAMIGKARKMNNNLSYYLSMEKMDAGYTAGFTINYLLGENLFMTSTNRWDSKSNKIGSGIVAKTKLDLEEDSLLVNPTESGDSSIHGVVFLDTNNNKVLDEGDERVEGLEIQSRKEKARSNEQGEFFIPNIASREIGTLKNSIKNDFYQAGYTVEKIIKYDTLPGESMNINIMLKKIKTVIGSIKFSSDFYLEDVETVLNGMKIKFINVDTGKEVIASPIDEMFLLNLEEGTYKMKLILNKAASQIDINLEERKVVITNSEETEKYIDLFITKKPLESSNSGDTGKILDKMQIKFINIETGKEELLSFIGEAYRVNLREGSYKVELILDKDIDQKDIILEETIIEIGNEEKKKKKIKLLIYEQGNKTIYKIKN